MADASQNAITDDYSSITDGLIPVIRIILWNHILNFLGYTFPSFQKFIHPPPILLIKNGIINRKNLRKEFITEDELRSQIREQGIATIEEVKEAYMEMDGRISVIQNQKIPKPVKKKLGKM